MKVVKFMQEGGVAPAAPVEAAPAGQETGGDVIMQIADIFAQALQNGDCNMLAQGAEMFIQLVSQAMGQGVPQGPVDQAPEGEPIFKRGGRLVRRKKCSK